MKALKLYLEGFTCYRNPVEIDFSDLHLFAITGSTGAGKSSLIDAMIFALYGKVPRLSNDTRLLVSQGAKALKISFDFRAGGEIYRLVRRLHSNRNVGALLEIQREGKWAPKASGVRQVAGAVENLLGLDYEAFTRCIVLPQGEFERFLKDTASRQEILGKLLNFEVLSRMQRRINSELDQMRQQASGLEVRLNTDYAQANSANLDAVYLRLQEMESEIGEQSRLRQEVTGRLSEARLVWRFLQEKKAIDRERQSLLAQSEEIASLEIKVNRAKALLPMLPRLARFRDVEERLRNLRRQGEELAQQTRAGQAETQKAQEELTQAQARHRELPGLEQMLERLAASKGLRQESQSLRATLQREESTHRQQEERRDQLAQKLADLAGERVRREKELRRLASELESLKAEQSRLAPVREAEGLLKEVERAQRLFQEREQKKAQTEQALSEAKRAEQISETAYCACQTQQQVCQEALAKQGNAEELAHQLLQIERARSLAERCKAIRAEGETRAVRLHQEQSLCAQLQRENERERKVLAETQSQWQMTKELVTTTEKANEEARALLNEYRLSRTTCETQQRELLAGENEQKRLAQLLEGLLQKMMATGQAIGQREEELHQWREAFEHEQHLHATFLLRQGLAAGSRCPVCEGKVEIIPPLLSDADPTQAQVALRQGEAALATLREQKAAFQSQQEELTRNWQRLGEQVAQMRSGYQKEAEAAAHKERRLAILLPGRGAWQGRLAQREEACQIQREETERLGKRCAAGEAALAAREARWDQLQQSIAEKERLREEARASCLALEAEIVACCGSVAPDVRAAEILARQAALHKAQESLALAERALAEARLASESARQTKLAREQQWTVAEEERQCARTHWQERRASLLTRLQITGEVDPQLEQKLRENLERFRLVEDSLSKANKRWESETAQLEKLRLEESKDQAVLTELGVNLPRSSQRLGELHARLQEIEKQLVEITGGEAPEKVEDRLKRTREKILQATQQAHDAWLTAQGKAAHHRQNLAQQVRQEEEWTQHQSDLERELLSALKPLGLSTIAQLAEANQTGDPTVVESWEKRIHDYQERSHLLEGRLAACQEYLQNRTVETMAIEELEEQLSLTERALQEKIVERGSLEEKRSYLENAVKKAHQLTEELRHVRTTQETSQQLSQDLRADRFPAFLLEEALNALAEDGSVQLDLLSSGRYAFQMEKREFFVLDRWSADEIRPVKTLSGGETFLASLALALALSDRIYQLGHRMGGSAVLESLFIDEGFGSLDDEHLDLALKALDNLQGTGRTVGIVSHLTTFSNQLPVRLVVSKNREGSTVTKEWSV